MNTINNLQDVKDYYHTWESKLGYVLLLKGTRHFGYYPEGKPKISFAQAQEEMNHQLALRLDLPGGSRILDAGCGEGNTAIYLAKTCGYHLEAIDLLDESVLRAKKRIHEEHLDGQIDLRAGDYATYPWKENSFDAIYTMETLVHLANYPEALSHFYEVLKPGGKLVLFEYSMTPPKDLKLPQTHLWNSIIEHTSMYGLPHFHHDKFAQIVAAAGFSDINVENITPRMMPMLQAFSRIGTVPYHLIKFLGLEKKFVNAMFAVEAYHDILKHGTWRYNIITAKKA